LFRFPHFPVAAFQNAPLWDRQAMQACWVKMEKHTEGFVTTSTAGLLHAGLLVTAGLAATMAALSQLF
jgi:hypothetical protein